ncbi:stage II sporulation protein P [Romboutsia lituseburensis]|uniref:stage II sporulation protein P n=1 Tax=Romboutsia lituseburensis TaxID=1537 RepID=UPI00215A1421|nr:stage II sporulation protein P [Romboutsia lituseburensis]MCR8746554.1 stage II sporulation protein P [Romboutsia lituseburensis]
MLKKRIKTLVMSCVLVCILPITSIAMDKDEFLKFLVNSSYPESKEESGIKEYKENANTQKYEKDYMKFHVGEENIPTINNENQKEETTNNADNANSSIAANSSKYINDVRVTKDQPRILLYHTHTGETYSNSPGGNYHSQDKPNSVLEIGTMLTDELTKRGWGVVHSSKYHDYPSFNGAYMSSRQTLDALMPKYPSVDIAIDLHRDGRDLTDSVAMKNEHERATSTYKGESVAKFLFVVGMKNENVSHVQGLANDITSYAMKKYPELVLPVVKKPYGKFNQSVAPNHLLIEVGSNGTTIQEAQASVKYIADVLDGYFKTK